MLSELNFNNESKLMDADSEELREILAKIPTQQEFNILDFPSHKLVGIQKALEKMPKPKEQAIATKATNSKRASYDIMKSTSPRLSIQSKETTTKSKLAKNKGLPKLNFSVKGSRDAYEF